MAANKREWILKKSRRGGMCYLFCTYSLSRKLAIVSDPNNRYKYNVEVRYSGKNRNKRRANYKIMNIWTGNCQFDTIEGAMEAAQSQIDKWDSPENDKVSDLDSINRPFENYAKKMNLCYSYED